MQDWSQGKVRWRSCRKQRVSKVGGAGELSRKDWEGGEEEEGAVGTEKKREGGKFSVSLRLALHLKGTSALNEEEGHL